MTPRTLPEVRWPRKAISESRTDARAAGKKSLPNGERARTTWSKVLPSVPRVGLLFASPMDADPRILWNQVTRANNRVQLDHFLSHGIKVCDARFCRQITWRLGFGPRRRLPSSNLSDAPRLKAATRAFVQNMHGGHFSPVRFPFSDCQTRGSAA